MSGGEKQHTRLAALVNAGNLYQRARCSDIAPRVHDFHVGAVHVELRIDLVRKDMLEAQEVMSGGRCFGNREVVLTHTAVRRLVS